MTFADSHRIRNAAAYVREIAFVLAVLAFGLVVAGFVIGLNPFVSLVPALVLVVSPLIMLGHHGWFVRHRSEILTDRDRLAARERRGF